MNSSFYEFTNNNIQSIMSVSSLFDFLISAKASDFGVA
jgi:hypothetical protein